MIVDSPDGHRCVYERREGTGPRGGRRTWTTARCIACGAVAEAMDPRPGCDSSWNARSRLTAATPRCQVPIEPPLGERALQALVDAVGKPEAAFPPLAWVVEYMPHGGDIDAAIQKAWQECENVQLMGAAMKAFGMGGRLVRWNSGDEVCQREYIAFELGGASIDLHGAAGPVTRALRLHVPRLEWSRP